MNLYSGDILMTVLKNVTFSEVTFELETHAKTFQN